jgi:hypothetical protein
MDSFAVIRVANAAKSSNRSLAGDHGAHFAARWPSIAIHARSDTGDDRILHLQWPTYRPVLERSRCAWLSA